jgi:hypothetical protein
MKTTTCIALLSALGFAACVPPSTYVRDVSYNGNGDLTVVNCDFDYRGRATDTCHEDTTPRPMPPTQAEIDTAKAPAPVHAAPSATQVSSALASPSVHRLVELCRAQYAETADSFAFTLTVAPSGAIDIAPHDASGPFADCAVRALRSANLGTHDGAAVSFEQQVTL